MNFATWSIRNPVPAILLFVLLSLVGLASFISLPIQDFPDLELPLVTVSARLDGAAPAQLETEVARKLEDRIATLSQLEHINTTITDGKVEISVLFDIDKNAAEAVSEVRNAVDAARASLPAGMESPSVARATMANTPLLTFAVEGGSFSEEELSWFVDNDLSKALLAVPGVAAIKRVGGVDRELHVDLDPVALNGLGLTASEVASSLRAVQLDGSGGRGELGGQRQAVRTLGALHAPTDLAALMLPVNGGRLIRLGDVARIADTHAERSTLAFADGHAVIGFQVLRSKGYSDLAVATDFRAATKAFAASHPQLRISEVSNTVEAVRDNYRGSLQLLLEGALLAVIVVWGFLRDWRATVISATALPLSILPTFAVMRWAGFTLNSVSLIALALVVGILVDDAIVEVENIARHLRMGKSPLQAAKDAAEEIGLAVVATTLTLVAVFLPTAFMGGIPGLIFRQFGITAAAAVLASLLVARLLTPMMSAYLMRAEDGIDTEPTWLSRYLGWVRGGLRHRSATLGAAVVFFIGSLALTPLLSAGFLPPMDHGQTTITLELPPGSNLAETTEAARMADELIRRQAGVQHVFTTVGVATRGDGPDASTSNDTRTATLLVDLKAHDERWPLAEVERALRKALAAVPGARVTVGSGGDGERLEITLASDDSQQLEATAAAVEREMHTLHGVGGVHSNAALQRPELRIYPDRNQAAALGVSVEAISEAVRLATNGDYSANLNKLNLAQRQLDIRVQLDPQLREDLGALVELRLPGNQGLVALGAVAEIRRESGTAEIGRTDRYRKLTLSVELNGRALGDVLNEVHALPAMRKLPKGVFEIEQGEAQRMGKLFASFGVAMLIGVFCIYAVLVLLLHDFLQPVTILAALPLSLGGALIALVITHTHFTMPVIIGMLMLMGVVTKNSILLVEYAVVARRTQGLTRLEALLDACHKRARPILMTTTAMAAGMLPVALGLGTDPSFRQPMAIVVIGGLLASTLLSLLVIPVVFTYVDDFLQLFRTAQPDNNTSGDGAPNTPPASTEPQSAPQGGSPSAPGAAGLDWRLLAPLFIVVMIDAISGGVILPQLPFYSTEMGATPFVVGVLVASFSLCQFVSAPWLGKWSDRYGRKPVLLASQAGTFASLITLALAPSLPWVFLARIVDGLTSGNLSVAAAYAVDHSTPTTRKRAIGVVSAAMGIGLMIGPALSGLFSHLSPTAPIWAAAVVSLISVIATSVLLPNHEPAGHAPAKPGGGVTKPGKLLAQPATLVMLGLLTAYFFAFSMYLSQCALFLGARFTWNGLPLGPREVGIAFASAGALNVWVQLKGMKWAERLFNDRQLVLVAFSLVASGFAALAFAHSLLALALAMATCSVGTSLLRPTLIAALSATAAGSQQGQMMGLNQSLMAICNVLAPPIAGLMIGASLYTGWALSLAGLMAAGLVGAIVVMGSRHWPHGAAARV